MIDWYTLAIIGLFCYGIQHFLYKISAEKKCNTAWTTFSFMAIVAVLSSILFFVLKEPVINIHFLFFIAVLNAVIYLTQTVTIIEALKKIDTSIAYPIIRLYPVLVVIFSILYFRDILSFNQGIGIILAIVVILILTRKSNGEKITHKNFRLGIMLSSIAFFAGAASTITVKFAAIAVNTLGFMSLSYIFNTFLSLGLRKRLQTEKENPRQRDALIIGFFIGLFNFAGFYILLKALSIGPLSIISTIVSLFFVITILLSVFIYKEKLTSRRILGIFLAILAVILMRV